MVVGCIHLVGERDLFEIVDVHRLRGLVHRTPLVPSAALSSHLGARVYLKLECLQKTGSFKPRGAYLRISRQMTEVLVTHRGMGERAARQAAIDMLDRVQIPQARQRFDMYPHEFSGGMRQRVMIAMALLCRPDLLISDEPTTALDVTIQAQILELLRDIKREGNMAIVLITHALGVVAGLCERVLVMYGGRIVEEEPVR